MKRTVKLLLLTLTLALLACGYIATTYFTKRYNESQIPEGAAGEYTVAEYAQGEIAALEWDFMGVHHKLARVGGEWELDGDAEFNVDANIADPMAAAFARVIATRALTADPNSAEWGLADPACAVTVTDIRGAERRFALGAQNEVTGEYYLSVSDDGARVYTVKDSFAALFMAEAADLYKYDDIPALDDVRALTIEDASGARSLEYIQDVSALDYSNARHFYSGGIALDDARVSELLGALKGFEWLDLGAYRADAGELEAFGFGGAQTKIRAEYMHEGERREFAFELGGETAGGGYYARLPGASTVYCVGGDFAYLALGFAPEAYRSTQLIYTDAEAVASLTCALSNFTVTFETAYERAPGATDTEAGGDTRTVAANGVNIDTDDFDALIEALCGLETGARADASARAVLSLTLRRNADAFEEVTLLFEERDAEYYTVTAFGETRLVSAERVDRLARMIRRFA